MPAQCTHQIFALEAFEKAFPEKKKDVARNRSIITFAAQGPDFFYHNQRTKPLSFEYGKILHNGGYGRLIAEMVERAQQKGQTARSKSGAFTLAFMTHAVLDRYTHPFIMYFSGWVDPQKPETARYYQCHPFFERIIDVLILKKRGKTAVSNYDFLSQVDLGAGLPEEIIDLLLEAIPAAYPDVRRPVLTRKRIENAYEDTMHFFRMTNPPDVEEKKRLYRKDLMKPERRFLALIHPVSIPHEYDFLNEKHAQWCHPWDRHETSTASFLELYEAALERAVESLKDIAKAFAGKLSKEELENRLGNESLNSGKAGSPTSVPQYSKPFPFPDMIDSLYQS